jgi:hypothetical protein
MLLQSVARAAGTRTGLTMFVKCSYVLSMARIGFRARSHCRGRAPLFDIVDLARNADAVPRAAACAIAMMRNDDVSQRFFAPRGLRQPRRVPLPGMRCRRM